MIDVVICVHNGLDVVKVCLDSVQSKTSQEINLIIIDDGSDNATRRYLEKFAKKYPCTIIRNEKARGYTASANQGLKKSTSRYCVLLNSDTIVTPRWLEKMTETMESDKRIGIVGPLSNAASWQSVPGMNSSENGLEPHMTVDQMAELVYYASEKIFPRTMFLNGFCLMIKREVIERIGYFDEINFPIGYGEEDDYCIRARGANFKLKVANHCYIYHQKSASFGSERRQQLAQSGKAALFRKHGMKEVKQSIQKMVDHQHLQETRDKIKWLLECRQHIHKGKQRKNVIYTAITGNYDRLQDPVQMSEKCDYYCFTDNPLLKSSSWKIILLGKIFVDPARQARWVKIMPHLFFQDYEHSVWVDGNIRVIGDIDAFIEKYSSGLPSAFYKHSIRNCIYKEADACITLGKDRKDVILKQISLYKQAGYPKNNGLIESGVILRRHNDLVVIRTMTAWWRQIISYSKRDQISFNYIAWKTKVPFTVIDDYIRDNEFFKWSKHQQKSKVDRMKLLRP
ncbi:glycosyltransferase [Paenibacillus sp. N3/727]|uniref:glycosyltransferase n=1 Tax=Paenibacillus sp. N3/727 TaxID=2925845 RepID=UPI001F52FA5A|nr:glycosyltransferase [Paenibacillus sp. N3/727]UNK19755.1 glycosyltransferase [Paenibacillus sp. N3/727]